MATRPSSEYLPMVKGKIDGYYKVDKVYFGSVQKRPCLKLNLSTYIPLGEAPSANIQIKDAAGRTDFVWSDGTTIQTRRLILKRKRINLPDKSLPHKNKSPASHSMFLTKKKRAALSNTQYTDIQRIEDEKVRRSTILHSPIQTMCQPYFSSKNHRPYDNSM
nr:hypothetical protein [uncultured Bacteroides sp.]